MNKVGYNFKAASSRILLHVDLLVVYLYLVGYYVVTY